jgi:hypothetical protein
VGRLALLGLCLVSLGCRVHFDAVPGDGGEDTDPTLAHVELAEGWSVAVYRDFSDEFTYVAADFVDTDETYDNQPGTIGFLSAPFPEEMVVASGRSLLELSPTLYRERTYGQHLPDSATLPDTVRCPQFVANLDGSPGILVSSSSRNGGDGTFIIAPDFSIAVDKVVNNVRCAIWDASGTFDSRGTPEAYLAASNGIIRRSDNAVVINNQDHEQIKLTPDGSAILGARYDSTDTTMNLISMASGGHAETMLAHATDLRIGPGNIPGTNGAVITELDTLFTIGDGSISQVAHSADANYAWFSLGTPPAGHPLELEPNGTIYVVESNRTDDVDRILVLTKN